MSKTAISIILERQHFFTYRHLFYGLRIYKTQSQFSGVCGLKTHNKKDTFVIFKEKDTFVILKIVGLIISQCNT